MKGLALAMLLVGGLVPQVAMMTTTRECNCIEYSSRVERGHGIALHRRNLNWGALVQYLVETSV